MFTGPICSMRWRRARQVSSSAASSSPSRRAISSSARSTCASTLTSARQLASRCSRSERSLATSLERLARSSRNWSSAARPVLSCVSIAANCWRSACAWAASVCASASASARIAASSFCRLASSALSRMRCSRSASAPRALLLDGEHTALQVGMEPVDALEGSLGAAPALFQAGQLGGHLRRFLLQAFALLRAAVASCACSSSSAASACACSASRRVRLLALLRRSTSAWPRARPCCAPPAASTPAAAARCADFSPSICFSAAPWLARRSPPGAARALRASSCAVSSSMVRVSAAASVSACARAVSSLASRPSASRNSRFSASGPSLAGLPPVTVALWKHSPPAVRKYACG